MDNNEKKNKIFTIIVTALVSLIISIAACILGISPEEMKSNAPDIGQCADYGQSVSFAQTDYDLNNFIKS